MKNITIFLRRNLALAVAVGSAALSLGTMSCSIDDSLNNSPNDIQAGQLASAPGVYGLLVGTQTMAGDFYSGDRSRIGSIFSWQVYAPEGFGRAQPESWDGYILDPTGPPEDMWKYAYKAYKVTTDVRTYARQATFSTDAKVNTATQNTIIGISQFYRGLILGEVAAYYGHAPIAINGVEPAKYVSETEVYAEAQRVLDSALTNVEGAAIAQDLNFGGDAKQWTAAIHSLKARYFLHMSDYANALKESKLGIADPSGTVKAFYSSTTGEYSPWGHWTIVEQDMRGLKTFVDSLKSEPGDKRLAQYFAPNGSGFRVGFNGRGEVLKTKEDSTGVADPSVFNEYGTFDASFPLISSQENTLIRAECEARAEDVASAVTDVNAIRIAAGLTAFASTDATATIAQILKQKWLQLWLEGQAYSDMRRTKTMFEVVPHTANQPGNLRIIYPSSENNANPNVPADNDALVKPLSAY